MQSTFSRSLGWQASASLLACAVFATACASPGELGDDPGRGESDGSGGTTGAGGAAGGAGGVPPDGNTMKPGCDQDQGAGAPECAVFTIDRDGGLHRFDPPPDASDGCIDGAFTLIGTLDCPQDVGDEGSAPVEPYSMAVDRNGKAWMVGSNSKLYQIDITTAHCTPTAYEPGQQNVGWFGMGYVSDSPGATTETLFVHANNYGGSFGPQGLAKIDTETLTLTLIGEDTLASAELTGTGDARLYGVFREEVFRLSEIDKATGDRISNTALDLGLDGAPNGLSFAFAFWGGDFWIFLGQFTSNVYRYRPSDKTVTTVGSVPFEIVGAGVSTCAPVETPK